MSGFWRSTRKETNNGEKLLKIDYLLDITIQDIVIHCVPLSNDFFTRYFRGNGKYYQMFLHPALTFT